MFFRGLFDFQQMSQNRLYLSIYLSVWCGWFLIYQVLNWIHLWNLDQSKERYEESLQKAKKTLKTVENMNEDQLQNKAEILANIHSQIGNAYLELGKYNESLKHHEEDLKISKEK